MKLCVVGGGGFRTPHVWEALLRDGGSPRVDSVTLHDSDPLRLGVMEAVCRALAAGAPDPPALVSTTDLRTAVEGSDVVFAAVRVGGLDGRCADEHVALDLGVLGQETTGPGGIAYAIRTVPVMMRLAELVREVAPTAYLLNFTNPAGVITEATSTVLGDRVVGICDTPSGLGRAVAAATGADPARLELDYVGLNHLGWLRAARLDGHDLLPGLLADDARLSLLAETEVFGADWLRTLRCLPNEYLYYYYRTRDAVAAIRAARQTRGDFLRTSQEAFYASAAADLDGAATLWRQAVDHRNASYMAEAKGTEQGEAEVAGEEAEPGTEGYAGVALSVMAAIARDESSVHILDVRNGGVVPGMPDDAVVEVPTRVDGSGLHPLPLASPPDLHQSGLMQQLKAVERHAIAAALTGDPDEALLAFALHPLVDSVSVARDLLAGYRQALPELDAVLR